MNWDHFLIYESGKVIINDNLRLDIVNLPSGRYFLNKESIEKIKKSSPEELIKNPECAIYTLVGDYLKNENRGPTCRITNTKRLSKIIEEIGNIKI